MDRRSHRRIISRFSSRTLRKLPSIARLLPGWSAIASNFITKPSIPISLPARSVRSPWAFVSTSSKSPAAYEEVIYCKGAWIMHMLREMLRQPNSHDPDARFMALLHTLVTKYAQKRFSTEQFQREVEAVMTPKMDLEGGRSMEWFFEEYVRGTGIPHYNVSSPLAAPKRATRCAASSFNTGVPHSFIAPVPLYVGSAAGRSVFLGHGRSCRRRNFILLHTRQSIRTRFSSIRSMTLLCASGIIRTTDFRVGRVYFGLFSINCFSSIGLSRFNSALPPSPNT